MSLAFWPYVRMVLVAATLLLGLAVAGMMVLLKLGVDLVSHAFEHRRLGFERPTA